MAIVSRDTQLVALQAASEAVWSSLATLTASSYTQLVAASAERRYGSWIYNNNAVSTTSRVYIYKNAAPTSDADAIVSYPVAATVSPQVVFIPGTGAVFGKSVNSGVMASLVILEQ